MCKYDVIHKPGAHNVPEGTCTTHVQNSGEDWTCCSGDMLADKQINTQTGTLVTIPSSPTGGDAKTRKKSGYYGLQ